MWSSLFLGVAGPFAPARRTVCAVQNRMPRLATRLRLPHSIGGCDDDLQSLSFIEGLFCHHFSARNFCVFISDDNLLAFVLINRARPSQDFLSSKLIMFIRKGSMSTCIS
jgi:hypothetical protein